MKMNLWEKPSKSILNLEHALWDLHFLVGPSLITKFAKIYAKKFGIDRAKNDVKTLG